MHDEHVVALGRHAFDDHARRAGEQFDGARLDAVDDVDLARLQRGNTRGGVVHHDDLDGIDMADIVAPVAVIFGADVAHAGLVDLDLVGPGAEAASGCPYRHSAGSRGW